MDSWRSESWRAASDWTVSSKRSWSWTNPKAKALKIKLYAPGGSFGRPDFYLEYWDHGSSGFNQKSLKAKDQESAFKEAEKMAKDLLKASAKSDELTLSFHECEHGDDMDHYISHLTSSGATILDTDLDRDEESCTIKIKVSDKKLFLERFKKTDSYGFSNLSN